jgi:cation:H+ antiporter
VAVWHFAVEPAPGRTTVPGGPGLLFTPWKSDVALAWSGAVTMLAIVYPLTTPRAGTARLTGVGALYGVFSFGLIPIVP